MGLITVNEEKCIKCGFCVEECPSAIIKMESTGPVEVEGGFCIACGHCVAVCPKGALDNERSPLAKQSEIGEIEKLNPEEAKNFLRSRRSIRSFKSKPVEREKLIQLVDVAHLAPTGSNSQGISFLIIDDKKTIENVLDEFADWAENHEIMSRYFGNMLKEYRETKVDRILRGAPSLVLSLSDKDFNRGRENSIFALTYLELYAPSLGLGSCWAGILEACALSEDSPLNKLLHIPEDKKITGCVMVGYPKNKFKRFTERQPLSVSFFND